MDLANYPPRIGFDDPEMEKVQEFLALYGQSFSEALRHRRVKHWIVGPSPDGSIICGCFTLEEGETLEFSFDADEVESLLGFLGVSWRMAAERAALHGKQDGNA